MAVKSRIFKSGVQNFNWPAGAPRSMLLSSSENQDLERVTFCEQKAFPLKLPLQKNFEYLKLSLKFKELNSIGRGARRGHNTF